MGDGPEIPAWVRDWCHRTGRELHTRLTPVASLPELIQAIGPCNDDPVLVNRATPGTAPAHLTVALKALPDDAPVLAEAARAASDLDGTLQVVHGVPLSYGARSVGLDGAVARGERLLDAARHRLATEAPDVAVATRLERARPHEVVSAVACGLLVVGGPVAGAPYGPHRFGPVTSSALQHCPCAVLLVPRLPTSATLAA
jgi:hypothetical protein